ncbi:MAG: hypothetical protein KH230_09535 [Enterocloster asparagiformis]|nr:hypothetical protein [Enterocloster asparagiformis]
MGKWNALRILRLLLIEAALLFFCLVILPRLNFEGVVYRTARPVDLDTVLAQKEGQTGAAVCYAGYPSLEPTAGIASEADLQRNYIAALEIDASRLEATGIYKQSGHHSNPVSQRGYYASRSTSYGITAPAVTRSRLVKFWMKPYAEYAQYYLITFEDGSRAWALIDDAITKIPRKGAVRLPVGYYWDEGAGRFLTEQEKKRYHISEDVYMGNCMDLYSGWVEGEEMARFSERLSFIQSMALAVLGTLLFVTLIILILPARRKR